LNGQTAWGDPANNNALVSWLLPQSTAFATTVEKAIDFLLNRVPMDPATGLPLYYSQSCFNIGDPLSITNYQYNPAGLLSMLIDSGIGWSQLSGDARLLNLSQKLADFHLANGLTSSLAAWPGVPYAASHAATVPYDGAEDGTTGVVEPDKIGEVGYQLARLSEVTGNQAYLAAATHDADVLAANVQTGDATHSPWPFRVVAPTNVILNAYTADVIRPIQLFDELIKLQAGNTSAYVQARAQAWQWLMSYPMQNNVWSNYFEDVPDDISNYNQYIPLETARYLLLNPGSDPNAVGKAQTLISWAGSTFGITQFGATTIAEQLSYFLAMGSHTSRYGSVLALLAKATGDPSLKDQAFRSLNWATYMLRTDEQVIVGPDDSQGWFTDGYGDYIRHFVSAMTTFPEWAGGIP
jgi:hypothetical protein